MLNNKFISFPDIEQFRNIVKYISDRARYSGKDENGDAIFDLSKELPKIKFKGTVKLHGTNAGITLTKDGDMYAQSRESIMTTNNDNAGFAFFVESNKKEIAKLFEIIDFEDADYITIFGEWCGGNIQKGVAINKLPKMFVIFDVKLSYEDIDKNNYFLSDDKIKDLKNADLRIFNILDFETYDIEIDFNNPALSQEKLAEITNSVEKECPVGRYFGSIGIGEGVVWKYLDDKVAVRFKVKGEKHSSSKVKKIANIDTEKINSIKEFAQYSVTESRLSQGIEKVFTSNNEDIDIKKIGMFLKWIYNDIIKEESDTLIDNMLEPKDVSSEISNVARKWFLDKWNKF